MRWAAFSHEVRLTAALGVALGAASGAAQAQELRVGAGYSPHGPEEGASVIVEYLFPPVQALKAVGTPRPFLST